MKQEKELQKQREQAESSDNSPAIVEMYPHYKNAKQERVCISFHSFRG
jgi:hypothetical protein